MSNMTYCMFENTHKEGFWQDVEPYAWIANKKW